MTRQLHLNLFIYPDGHHEAAWRHPDVEPARALALQHYVDIARTAERRMRSGSPASETITVHATCTNRDLPARLPFGGDQGDFELDAQAPISRVRCLRNRSSWKPRKKRSA